MRGINLPEQAHYVNVLPPVDITGGKVGAEFHMKNHSKANIMVQIGVSAAAPTAILVKECSNAAGDNAVAIGFDYYAEETADGDTLSAKQTATASGITPSANNGIMYIIVIDASQLSATKPWIQVSFTNGTNSVIASISAVLTGARYAEAASTLTAIA